MNKLELSKRYVNVWLEFDQVTKLEEMAREKKVEVGAVVQEIITPLLDGGDENEGGRFILLRIPSLTYRQHLKWFDGDVELAKSSMVGSVVVTGEEFADATDKASVAMRQD
jgi:hypothetical protein